MKWKKDFPKTIPEAKRKEINAENKFKKQTKKFFKIQR